MNSNPNFEKIGRKFNRISKPNYKLLFKTLFNLDFISPSRFNDNLPIYLNLLFLTSKFNFDLTKGQLQGWYNMLLLIGTL